MARKNGNKISYKSLPSSPDRVDRTWCVEFIFVFNFVIHQFRRQCKMKWFRPKYRFWPQPVTCEQNSFRPTSAPKQFGEKKIAVVPSYGSNTRNREILCVRCANCNRNAANWPRNGWKANDCRKWMNKIIADNNHFNRNQIVHNTVRQAHN